MATLKLFDAGAWVPIHTAVFDVLLPTLSPDAWKALCVAIRQAQGATNGHGAMSCAQFQAKMGCESQSVARRALQECLEAGYLVQYEIEAGQDEATYALNRDLDLQVGDDVEAASTETRPVQQQEIGADDDLSPADRFLVAAWRFATGTEITADGLDVLYGLLGPDLAIGSLVNVLLELGGRVDNVTVELLEAVATGQINIPLLEAWEEDEPPPPEQPHGPVMAATTETDPVLAAVIKLYENEIGLVTQGTAQQLMALTAEHRDLDKWQEAFNAVVRSNVRRLDYLVTCLENVGKPKSKRPGRRGGGGRRQESTIKEKPPAENIDAKTLERQRAALAKLRRKQGERK